jgi:hypothetical protein
MVSGLLYFIFIHSIAFLAHAQVSEIAQIPLPTQCARQCSAISRAIATCVNDMCLCPVALVDGPPCTACLAPINADIAFVYGGAIIPKCQNFGPLPTLCASQCSRIDDANLYCIEDSCFCPVLLADGPGCSQCWATVNATEARLVAEAISICQTEFPAPMTLASITLTSIPHCSACFTIVLASATCLEDSCYCPIVLSQASQCSQCWASADSRVASQAGSVLRSCQAASYRYYPSLDVTITEIEAQQLQIDKSLSIPLPRVQVPDQPNQQE